MTFVTAPPFRIDSVRQHLARASEFADATTPGELLAAELLAEFKARVQADAAKNGLTAQQVADAFEAAEQRAKLAAENAVCPNCKHRWADHVGRCGCLECDDCRARRPARQVSWTPQVLPTPAQVARAYDAEERHFPQAGAR